MDKSLKDIIALYKDCSELIDKTADWTWKDTLSVPLKINPFTALFEASQHIIQPMVESLLGWDANLISSLSRLIDLLKESSNKLEGAVTWKSIVQNSVKKLSYYLSKLQMKKYNPKAENEEQIKSNIAILFSANNVLPQIIKEVEYLLSAEVKAVFDSEAKTMGAQIVNLLSWTEKSIYADIRNYCMKIQKQASEYKDNVSNLLSKERELYFEAKKQQKSTTDEQKQTEEFLADKEKEDKQLEQFLGQK